MPTLLQALSAQMDKNRSRLHMPGHKGTLPYPLGEVAAYDFTELPDTDSLYEASGVLLELEKRFAALYQSKLSVLSAGGSTLCIQTMLALAATAGGLLCDRNIHTAAQNAMALLGIEPEWIFPEHAACGGIAAPPTPEQIGRALALHPDARAVYLTSPNYYGMIADIAGAARVCHERDALLLVDNAHGAHLPFCGGEAHPIALGADACCDSLHKMLPALTGAALLHLGPGAPWERERVKTCMSWFGSTSPSYLILLSADLLADALQGELPDRLRQAAARVSALRGEAAARGVPCLGAAASPLRLDPLRLTLPLPAGSSPEALRELCEQSGIEPELCDGLACVLLLGADSTPNDFARAAQLLSRAGADTAWESSCASPPLPRPLARAMTLRAALLAQSERVPLAQARGRVAAAGVTHCPPGIPLVICGEVLGDDAIFLLESYGFTEADVVK